MMEKWNNLWSMQQSTLNFCSHVHDGKSIDCIKLSYTTFKNKMKGVYLKSINQAVFSEDKCDNQ